MINIVTGGAGFLGSYLSEAILRYDMSCKVIAIDNLLTGTRFNLINALRNERFDFYECDIRDFDINYEYSIIHRELQSEDVDTIYNLACPASPVDYIKYPLESLHAGSTGIFNLLDTCRILDCNLIHASTSEVYGDPLVNPQTESYWGNVNPIGIRSVYDESKRFAEATIMAYRRTYGLNTKIIRIFNTYGPRMKVNDGRVVPNFIYQALNDKPITIYGDGKQTRSFCFYRDTINGIIRVRERGDNNPYNIGNPEEYSILDLAQMIKKICKTNNNLVFKPLPSDDPKQRKPDITRMKELGWQPTTDIWSGLEQTIEWFKNEKKK